MSDTVLVALITFLSGAVGAIAGAVGAYTAAKTAGEAQLRQIILDDYFKAKLDAFSKIHESFQVLGYQKNRVEFFEATRDFCQNIEVARLLSSQKTGESLLKFKKAVLEHIDAGNFEIKGDAQEFYTTRDEAFERMRKEMKTYRIPELKEEK